MDAFYASVEKLDRPELVGKSAYQLQEQTLGSDAAGTLSSRVSLSETHRHYEETLRLAKQAIQPFTHVILTGEVASVSGRREVGTEATFGSVASRQSPGRDRANAA
jgi:hypothetical protein